MAALRYVIPCGVAFFIVLLVCVIVQTKLSIILFWTSVHSVPEKLTGGKIPAKPRCLGESFETTWSPLHYNLRLDLDVENESFQGEVLIRGNMLSTASQVKLHYQNLTFNYVSLNGEQLPYNASDDEGILTIELEQMLNVGKPIEMLIRYDGIFHETGGIAMRLNKYNRPIIYSHLEPVNARRVWPCLDLPEYKATFGLSIRNPGRGLTVLSNMPQIPDKSTPDPKYIKFKRTPLMSTYLLAFVVCDHVPIASDKNITFWAPREDTSQILWAAQIAPSLLTALENYVGIEFTLPKLDFFVVPKFSMVGGMENWGLVMITDEAFYLNWNKSDSTRKNSAIASLTHELAHSWFGNLVTVKNWCYTWIQEGITTFLHGQISEQVFPQTNMVFNVKKNARTLMDTEYYFMAEPLRLRKEMNPFHSEPFSQTAYYKGATILYMVETFVTPPVMRHALQSFVTNNAYSNVTDVTFWNEVDKAVIKEDIKLPKSVKALMKPWTLQEGYPLVTILRDKETGQISAKQKVLRLKKGKNRYWWIPLSYTTSRRIDFEDRKPKIWMRPKSEVQYMNLTLDDNEWIVVNFKSDAYFRVNYDERTWHLLAEQLMSDHKAIDTITRAILINDAFDLATYGIIKFDIPLNLVKYLSKEEEAVPWESASVDIGLVMMSLKGAPKKLFKEFVQSLLDKAITDIATEHMYSTNGSQRPLKELISIAVDVQHPKLLNLSITTAEKVFAGKISDWQIHPDIRYSMWCLAIREGPPSIFEKRFKMYKAETDAKYKKDMIEQLVCSNNNASELLEEILASTPKSNVLEVLDLYMINNWATKCRTILTFWEKNQLSDSNNSTISTDFEPFVAGPAECVEDAKRIFKIEGNVDVPEIANDRWNDKSLQILSWLEDNFKKRPENDT